MVIARAVEPGVGHLSGHAHDESVAFPVGVGMAHPGVDLGGHLGLIDIENAIGFGVLVSNQDDIGRLHDLERKRHVIRARHARHEAFGEWIVFQCVGAIGVALAQCLLVVGNASAIDDAETRRDRRMGAEQAGMRAHPRRVGLDVVMRRSDRLPDAAEIGLAGRRAWNVVVLCPGRRRQQQRTAQNCGGRRAAHGYSAFHQHFVPSFKIGISRARANCRPRPDAARRRARRARCSSCRSCLRGRHTRKSAPPP